MSTTSVWAMDLGGAVTRVTRRRDGFRNRPDERFERGCGGLPQLVATSGGGKCEQSPQSSTLADEFLRAESRNVAILSYVADTSGLTDVGYGEIFFEARAIPQLVYPPVRVVRAFRPASEPLLLSSESAFSRRQTCFFFFADRALTPLPDLARHWISPGRF